MAESAPVDLSAELPQQLREALACPRCQAVLDWNETGARCPACAVDYPWREGILDFVGELKDLNG